MSLGVDRGTLPRIQGFQTSSGDQLAVRLPIRNRLIPNRVNIPKQLMADD